jgi:hypothetical protein
LDAAWPAAPLRAHRSPTKRPLEHPLESVIGGTIQMHTLHDNGIFRR